MLNSLLRLWHKFCDWITQRPAAMARIPDVKPYFPSNLHARHH